MAQLWSMAAAPAKGPDAPVHRSQRHVVVAAERAGDALADAAALALTLDEVEIGVASGRLLVHAALVRASDQ